MSFRACVLLQDAVMEWEKGHTLTIGWKERTAIRKRGKSDGAVDSRNRVGPWLTVLFLAAGIYFTVRFADFRSQGASYGGERQLEAC